MKNCLLAFCMFSFLLFSACAPAIKSNIDKTEQQEKVAKLIVMQNFVFEAMQANPQRISILNMLPNGQQLRNLPPGYYLSVTKDSVKADLPFYGRAYSGGFHTDDNGIKFKTHRFDYDLKYRKKGLYQITISIKDVTNVQQLVLYISVNGYATLQVQSINRDIMGFYGDISSTKTDIL